MDSRVVSTGPGLELRGALGYLRGKDEFPCIGMGIAARFGSHNAAFYVGLEKRSTPDIAHPSAKVGNLAVLLRPELTGGYQNMARHLASGAVYLTYDSLGQCSQCMATGTQLDLVA